jgi:hypothetical protein
MHRGNTVEEKLQNNLPTEQVTGENNEPTKTAPKPKAPTPKKKSK